MARGRYIDILKRRGFFCFFWTQFLGAFNDNFYKMIIILLALDIPPAAGGGSHYIPLIGALFILPFLLFSGYAGYLADVHSKRNVLVTTKFFEIVAMGLGLLAFFIGRIELMIVIVFLMGLQSTFFSPAKYGILPEMLPDRDLARGNGLLEMSTFLAIILGTAVGGTVYELWKDHLVWIGTGLLSIAVLGSLTSLGITKVPSSGAIKNFSFNPLREIFRGAYRLYHIPILWLTVLGISYFWFLGALLQMGLPIFGKTILAVGETQISLLWTFTAIGVGTGSLAAGRMSGDKIELGLVPLGALGMGIFSLMLFEFSSSYTGALFSLLLLGFSGGFFIVPLMALLQQRSGREQKGQFIATNNFLNMMAVLIASLILWTLDSVLGVSADKIILIAGIMTFGATACALLTLPDFFVRFVLWVLTHTVYRIRIIGSENLPARGPALLVSNHISFVDALLIGASLQRFIRFMLDRSYYEIPWLRWLFRLMRAVPVSAASRRGIVESLRAARRELEQGHVVCIFAEGAISRTGHLLPFKRGYEKIVEGLDVPIIPVHLDEVWGSIFSFNDGRFFWKKPKKIPYRVTVSFGAPLPPATTSQALRQAVLELGSNAAGQRQTTHGLLHAQFIRTAKRHWSAFCMVDTTGTELTFGRTLIGGMLLARWVRARCADERMVGIMLPASVGGALANIGVFLAGKIPVNLNFTAGEEAMAAAMHECGIKTILTARTFLGKAGLEQKPEMVYLEEIRGSFTTRQKLEAAVAAYLLPPSILSWRYARDQKPHDLATIIFSSGSTGMPKGVMLSHHNILANIEGMRQIITFSSTDRIMGILPFFHSFGFTVSLWLPAIVGFGAVYHPNPMDAKIIGETVDRYKATLLISTPTFYSSYIRRCSREQFGSLRYAISGAEKLPPQIAAAFKDKFGMDLLEGYGCTELAPVVSVNVPDFVDKNQRQIGHKSGTVGHPIPGVVAKIIDPETGKTLSSGENGLLLVKGPNCMLGYLGQPDLTDQVMSDGWYITGDIACLDEDGFIRITDRLSRFSKIGGEMVPHLKLEEVINAVLGNGAAVVTSVPDEQKGEKLVVFYSQNGVSAEEIWKKLNESELPNLWIPKRENFFPIEAIPVLGSGKVDLRTVKRLALEKTSDATSDA